MAESVDVSTWHSGVLYVRRSDAHLHSAVLSFDAERGTRITLSFASMAEDEASKEARLWFSGRDVPEAMMFTTGKQTFALFGVRWGGHSEPNGITHGILDVREAVVANPHGDPGSELRITELQSTLDPLLDWTGLTSTSFDSERDDDGLVHALTADVRSSEPVEWRQGEAQMSFTTVWGTDNSMPGLHVNDAVVLRSTYERPRPIHEHLEEHMRVRMLLSILYGADTPFRRHDVRDEMFYPRTYGGEVYSRSGQQAILSQTFQEHGVLAVDEKTLRMCVAKLAQVGPDGLQRWTEQFTTWRRFIYQASAIFRRRSAYLEDRILSLSMCLEAAGHILGPVANEDITYRGGPKGRPTMVTYVLRCIRSLGLDLSELADSDLGLARAIANSYRRIKHFDAGEDFPDGNESWLVSQVEMVVVRFLAVNILVPDGSLSANWQSLFSEVVGWFRTHELRVQDDGCFSSTRSDLDVIEA